MSASSFSFAFAVPMRGVSCVGDAPRTWNPRSLQSIPDVPLYFRRVVIDPQSAGITTTTTTTL